MVTSSWIASIIKETVKARPDISPRQLKQKLKEGYGLKLPYMKVWRSRATAKKLIFGEADDSYKLVLAFHHELLKCYPNSHVIFYYCHTDFSFKRFFVSFKDCVDGFIAGCIPLIGLDACHLKGKYLGMLFSATALDGNRHLYPIAYAVVECENKDTWQWFLKHLMLTLENNIENLSFISDMEKGIEDAVRLEAPQAEHRVCMATYGKISRRL
ncbi:hypothetical protein AXF42_Ash008626 [Apostasia shenzhenica]|uniref:MULE transposase domain-containing protein n=1 Tax=Apostasia shenzhenica TaxID=1088818 RepID=A0A2I0B1Y1_9ASPA|nr:hypothetical protein AXF42_Ash008626 [Apostasia shenzhenica]